MLAIAGAKGGCGKTTTTLGLAEAFARAGTPTLAVDADRQLPNLHVTAGVDREPTIASLEDETNVTSVAKPLPGASDVGILTAPKSSETIDFQSALERLHSDTTQVLVDCPSGAGPDVVEPIAAADRVVLVTTGTERSVRAAETTIDIARRLEVPIAGAILTKCDRVTEAFESAIDVPVLAIVPEDESPLTSEAIAETYDRAAAALLATDPSSRSTPPYGHRSDRVATGIDVLDRALDGGVPPGSIVALIADAPSQSELLLFEMTATRGTLYLSTQRSVDAVRHALESSMFAVGNPTVRQLDDATLEETADLITAMPDGANLIVDTANDLERLERDAYIDLLTTVKAHMLETDGVALLHCLTGGPPLENRLVTEHHADIVIDLQVVEGETTLEQHLSVPKFRSERAPGEKIELGSIGAFPTSTFHYESE